MAAAAPSPGQLFLYILLPILSFASIVTVVCYCYRKRRCCFAAKEETLLGSAEKTRFTVDMGKRKRRSSSFNSNSWDSTESYPGRPQDINRFTPSSRGYQNNDNNTKRSAGAAIIPAGVPRLDIKRTVVIGHALQRDSNRLPSPYLSQRRATSPAQSLPEHDKQTTSELLLANDLYRRHYSYDPALASRHIGENLAYCATSESDIPGRFRHSGPPTTPNFGPTEDTAKAPPSPKRLRHQGRINGKQNEPSFSRPTTQPRVSLVISPVENIDLESSDDSEPEPPPDGGRHRQLYSPSATQLNHKRSNGRGELQPGRGRKSSSSSREARSPSSQYSGRSSPALLEAVNEEDSTFEPRSQNVRRLRSSPINSTQGSLDMSALQAALSQHRGSEGEVTRHARKKEDEDGGHFREGLRRERTVSQSAAVPGGRRSGAVNIPISPYSSTFSLSIGKDSYPGKQSRRRSSMQMPIDLNQINPKLYEDLIKLPSLDSEEPDIEGPQVHFSLDYDKDMEVLTVKVIQVRNLPAQEFSGTCDPYCMVSLVPGFNARQSKVHRRTTDPEFEEKFAFPIKQKDTRFKTLEIRTYDFDQFSRDECTGVMEMKLDVFDFGFMTHYNLSKKIQLLEIQSSESVKGCGDLMLALSYLPSAEKLTVAIQKARNLKSPECRKGAPDPYIKVSIFRGSQRLKKKKTDAAQGTYNPVFNQALTFSVSTDLLQCPTLRITCQAVHDHKLAANEELGYLEIGPGSKNREELKHWQDVAGKHSNKPVARWHKLHPPETSQDDGRGSFLNIANVRRSSSSVLYPQGSRPDSARVSPASTRKSVT